MTPADLATALGYGAVTAATTALARQPTLAAGTPYVQAIEGALNTIVGVVAGLPHVPEPALGGLR